MKKFDNKFSTPIFIICKKYFEYLNSEPLKRFVKHFWGVPKDIATFFMIY
jgi:hypothetical protein